LTLRAAERDPTLPLQSTGPVGAERANYPDVLEVGSIAEDGEPPDDPSHLKDWLMVRDIRRRLVEAS
jgi:hypothetical protein